MLGPRAVGALAGVPLGYALAGEVPYAEFRAQLPGGRVVPSSSSQTSSGPSWRTRTAPRRVARTIARGSLPGTYVVRNATRVPGSAGTGTGSRATIVAWAMDTTLTSMKSMINAMDTSITVSQRTSQRSPPSRTVQWLGQTR